MNTALFVRSLREGLRWRRNPLAWIALAPAAALLFGAALRLVEYGPGPDWFGLLVRVDLVLILLATVGPFSAAIAEEKEEATLGLLRLTGLNPVSLLLGKSTARLVIGLLFLTAQIPGALLAFDLTKTAPRQIVAAYVALGAFTVLVANLALLASVVCRRVANAAALTATTLFVVFGGIPFIRWIAMLPVEIGFIETPGAFVEILDHAAEAIHAASPFPRLNRILESPFFGDILRAQVWSNLALGAGCFLAAWALFERFCGEEAEANPARPLPAGRRRWFAIFGPGRAWSAALAWKDFHFLAGGVPGLVLRIGIYAMLIAGVMFIQWRWTGELRWQEAGAFAVRIALIFGGIEAAVLAATTLRREWQEKTLSGLAMLPPGLRRVAYQKIFGCVLTLTPSLACFAFGWLCLSAYGAPLPLPEWSDRTMFGAAQGLLFLHVAAFLSLHLRRGALPATIGIFFALNGLVALTVIAAHEVPVLRWGAVLCGVGVIGLHWLIGQRMKTLAAEE